MLSRLVDTVFGCRHDRYSFPITVRAGSIRAAKSQRIGTYVACLDCGKEFAYDWQEMRVLEPNSRAAARSLVNEAA